MYKFHKISPQRRQAREQGWLQLAPGEWSAGVFIGLHGCLGLVDWRLQTGGLNQPWAL